jgi:hypothetical protein
MKSIRLFLLGEAIAFGAAALVHAGILPLGYEHEGAYVPEGIIGAVLLAGFVLTWVLPTWVRGIGMAAQGFALMGSLIGLYVGVIGVGPHTVPDFVFHAGIVLALLWGLVVATRHEDGSARLAAVAILQTLVRATGLLQIALGLLFWTGNLLVAVPFHIFVGMLFVVLLVVQAGLAAWAGGPRRLVLFTIAWALVVPAFGQTQGAILQGDFHWIVRVAHLLVGLVAMGPGERLAASARTHLQIGGRHQSTRVAAARGASA